MSWLKISVAGNVFYKTFYKNFIKTMLANSHNPEGRNLLTSRVLVIQKPIQTFVAVGILNNDNPGLCKDPGAKAL